MQEILRTALKVTREIKYINWKKLGRTVNLEQNKCISTLKEYNNVENMI